MMMIAPNPSLILCQFKRAFFHAEYFILSSQQTCCNFPDKNNLSWRVKMACPNHTASVKGLSWHKRKYCLPIRRLFITSFIIRCDVSLQPKCKVKGVRADFSESSAVLLLFHYFLVTRFLFLTREHQRRQKQSILFHFSLNKSLKASQQTCQEITIRINLDHNHHQGIQPSGDALSRTKAGHCYSLSDTTAASLQMQVPAHEIPAMDASVHMTSTWYYGRLRRSYFPLILSVSWGQSCILFWFPPPLEQFFLIPAPCPNVYIITTTSHLT